MDRYTAVDAYVAGETVRLVVSGAPSPKGKTMVEKLAWLAKHAEPMREALMLEPRGHAGMHGAMFTEAVLPKAHGGLLSMHAGGYPKVSGEAVMGAVLIALEDGILHLQDDESIYIDTPAGLLSAYPMRVADGGIGGVTLTGLYGYVHTPSLPVQFRGRKILVDVAFGGEFFPIVDGEAIGIPVDVEHAPELIRAAAPLKEIVDAALHELHPKLSKMDGVIFTAPGQTGGHLRSATVLEGGVLRRSPGVTSTNAIMAVLDAMGLLADDQHSFIHESIVGTQLYGRIFKREGPEGLNAIMPVIESPASIVARHEFPVAAGDLRFRI